MPDPKIPLARDASEDTAVPSKDMPKVVIRQSPSSQIHHESSTTSSTIRAGTGSPSGPAVGTITSFRNVSACHRCRVRKHRCDQRLPKCHSCEKARVPCVGYDPISKQEIPRSYIYFLEKRVEYLSDLLLQHHINFKQGVAYEEENVRNEFDTAVTPAPTGTSKPSKSHIQDGGTKWQSLPMMKSLHNDAGVESTAASPSHSRGSPCSELDQVSERLILHLFFGRPTRRAIMARSTQGGCDDISASSLCSFLSGFRVEATPESVAPVLPDYGRAEELVSSYLRHANYVLPALHPEILQQVLIETYCARSSDRSARSLFLLFIVFAIGAALPQKPCPSRPDNVNHLSWRMTTPNKRQRLSNELGSPQEFRGLAIIQLKRWLSFSSPDMPENLFQLQALILLANFSLHEPTSPGLGFLVDIAMRLAGDLRLHSDHDSGISLDHFKQTVCSGDRHLHKARFQDLPRRLWWCVYSLDRLVAPYLGRPFSIPDDAITTTFPSVMVESLVEQPTSKSAVETKHAAYHWVTLRTLRSEMHTALHYQHSQTIRHTKTNSRDRKAPICLRQHVSFAAWRLDMSRRLDEWRCRIPEFGGVGDSRQLNASLLEFEYWQSVIMLYRWSIEFPAGLVGLSSSASTIFGRFMIETCEDPDYICFKVAEAAKNAFQLHRELQNAGFINVTYLTAQDTFITGIHRHSLVLWKGS